jgi:cytochrome P450
VNVCLRAENGDLNAHMSFGSGPHKCPGSFLSEMLIEMAIPALARRFPNIVLRKERCQFVQTPMLQAPIALPCDTAQISRRVTAKLFDIRDMSSARHILHNDESFAPPPMAEHLATLAEKSGRDYDTAILIAQNAMFFMDDPRHNGLRTSIMALLGGNRLAKWESVMDTAIAGALTGLEQMPMPDLVTGFSDRLRQSAVAPILGISSLDPARFEEIVPGLQQVLEPWLPLRELDSVQAIFGEALSLMTVPARSGGAPSLLEGLLSDVPEGFDEQDIKAVALVLYGASFNLSHTLANILHWILIRPKEVRQGFDQPEWIDLHLNELLAQCSGPKYIYRIARHDVQVGDLTMNAGDTARLVVHGLNQQAPAGAGHVSFGRGLHSCVGAGLSRLAIRRAIPALFARFPKISLIAQGQAYFSMSQTVALSTLPCTLNTKQNEKDRVPKKPAN